MHWTTDRVRQSFLDFFAQRAHTIVPSASLIPMGDPTLLFTNAGMVPFKDYFLGIRTPSAPRIADCQKCLRISGKHNDLEAVGRDSYHHTFFEMLGNWSFGDYYKSEAIAFHWELTTRVWEIPPDRLWATVFKDDDEAESAWLKLGVLPRERIIRCGEKDNFWEMGDTGPCGPCSEIHIDRGAPASAFCPHDPARCAVNVDGCARYIELGNLVFIQYNRDSAGKLTPLPKKHVDTGTGLERVAAVLQSFERGALLGNYDIDLFITIIRRIELAAKSAGWQTPYGRGVESDISYRAIADHARTISFLIAEGLRPANTDREYVLRRLIRRAARHGRNLRIFKPFLAEVCDGVIAAMGAAYPELVAARDEIREVATQEEVRFGETLDRGLDLLYPEIRRLQQAKPRDGAAPVLSGEVAFKLYDTFGFPLDMMEADLRHEGLTLDRAGFDRLMAQQRERARAARKDEAAAPEITLGAGLESRFVNGHNEARSEILAAHREDTHLTIITAETPFYPEGGGQVGDRGVIEAESGGLLEIFDTRKRDRSILHLGRILRGDPAEFERGGRVILRIDRARRDAAMRNHSATHLLHYALREIRGTQVQQAGSLVEPRRLRFDFNHPGPIAEADLIALEDEINARIRENAAVTTEELPYDEALRAGALAFFGDKYGDRVRVVRMGDFSIELCGGTHVDRTGDIGVFKLAAETGIAAGVRRIEAFTGAGALAAIRAREAILVQIAGQLGASDAQIVERLARMQAREKELERKLQALEQKLNSGGSDPGAAEHVREIKGLMVVTRKMAGVDAKGLRELADRLREKYRSAVVALGSDLGDDKVALLVAVTPDLTASVNAGEIVKRIAPTVGGTGGGRAELAQAGGRDSSRIAEALERVAAIIADRA